MNLDNSFKPIVIICQPGTGSSLLARTLRACGMHVGNEHTWWKPEYDYHTEHSLLTDYERQLVQNRRTDDDVPGIFIFEKIESVLKSYVSEAQRNSWNVFGVKITSGLTNPVTHPLFADIFKECWPNCIFVTILRHPLGMMKRVRGSLIYTPSHIRDMSAWLHGWIDFVDILYTVISEGWIAIPFPEAWDTVLMEKIAIELGLTWTNEAEKLFESDNIKGAYTNEELDEFNRCFEHIEGIYSRIFSLCMGYK